MFGTFKLALENPFINISKQVRTQNASIRDPFRSLFRMLKFLECWSQHFYHMWFADLEGIVFQMQKKMQLEREWRIFSALKDPKTIFLLESRRSSEGNR